MPANRGTRSRRTSQPRPSARIAEPASSPLGETGAWSSEDWSRYLTDRFELPIEVSFGRSRSAPVQARAFETADGEAGWQLIWKKWLSKQLARPDSAALLLVAQVATDLRDAARARIDRTEALWETTGTFLP